MFVTGWGLQGAPFSYLLGRTHPSALYRRNRAQPRWVNTHRELDTRSASSTSSSSIEFRDELDFCCSHPNWAISSIPEPVDDANPGPILTQLMCDAFTQRIEYGSPRDAPPVILDFAELAARPKVFEETPKWAKRVKPLELLTEILIQHFTLSLVCKISRSGQ